MPNLRVGEDGLVYHVDDIQNAVQNNEREGLSPDSMIPAQYEMQQPGLENMGAYPIF